MNIYSLDNIKESELDKVGGKAKGLYLLNKCGLSVPQGFVLVGAENDLDLQLAADYYEKNGFGTVAVRSSATAEDGTDFSSAGQYETFLNVSGKNEVKKAIKDCIESLRSGRAESYSSYFNSAKSAGMCVVVQEMITPDAAGVCFTRDSDGKGILIEAVPGLGESLVSGNVKSHSYLVTDEPVKGDSLLNADMVAIIAGEAEKAKEFFGYELDMEWAVKDGKLYWLQARPLTVTETIDAFELDAKNIGPMSILTTCNVGEMLPGAVTPLSLSTSVSSIDYGMRKMIVKSGALKSFDDIPEGSCIANFGNHLFINMSPLYSIGDSVVGATREGVELSLCGRIIEGLERPPVPVKSKLSKINNARKYFGILMGVKGACRKIQNLAYSLNIPYCDNEKDQVREISDKLESMNEAFWLHYIASAFSGSMSSAIFLVLLEKGYSLDDARSRVAALLEEIEGIESVDILRSLREAAGAILKEKPAAARYDTEELAEYIRNCEGKPREALDAFLTRHGHRAIREAEMMSRSWHTDEYSLSNYLRSIFAAGGSVTPEPKTASDTLVTEVGKGLIRHILGYIVKQARKGVVYREFTKSMSIKVLDKFKTAYRHLAYLMKRSGILPEADLIFFLKHEEIKRLIDGEAGLVKKAVARRRIFEEQKQFRFPEVCAGVPHPVKRENTMPSGSKILSGSSISRGRATGTARVVKSVEEANKLQKGEIMVASFTDIGWSPYYCMLGALVTEVGSALSHGAVVAREYSLPLVANIPYATELIKTGDIISVDGYTGEVAILG
jgi:rifampicin phosphotransferase